MAHDKNRFGITVAECYAQHQAKEKQIMKNTPWTATGWNNIVVNDSQGNTIVACPQGAAFASLEDVQANARLIAAAPDMLGALKEANSTLSRLYEERRDDDMPAVVNLVREVIAKAEGA